MKCPSATCLWPAAPPSHRVTAALVLNLPSPAFYTGGSDGSIVWWSLAALPEIRPVALLCGHASTISDLSPCSSSEFDLHGPKALLSACADGVLCVWTAASGRCRRRRKLPPWAGSPSLVSPLPSSPRYACIICTSPDSVGHHAPEGSRCAVVIVDSWSLNVLRTVFHGSLPIGPVKSMMVIPLSDDGGQKRHDAILVDGHGKTKFFRVSEKEHDGEETTSPQRDSSSDATASISGRSFQDEPNAVAVAVSIDGKILALIWADYCVFKLVKDGATLGEIHLAGSSLLNEYSSKKSLLIGGMFLREEDEQNPSEPEDLADGFTRRFFAWSNTGAGVVYMVSISDATFKFQLLCEIPANPNILDENKSVHFCQLNQCLVRAESLCFRVGGSLVWKPVITNWCITKSEGMVDGRPYATEMLGEGSFSVEPAFACMNAVEEGAEKNIQDSYLGYSSGSSGKYGDGSSDFFGVNNAVSSSMVLSEDLYGPYAVVYGFYNGQIEICQFVNVFHEENSCSGRSNNSNYLQISDRVFDGHTGAVLGLAAHRMAPYSEELTFHNVLISGSMDCTTRIWNMDTGNLILVMHHHVAPIRQIILPPTWTCHPWNNCFLSVGEDCYVALVSLETLRVERMFPGHPSYPSMVAWDSTKGYIACLCRNLQSLSDAVSVLYLWDVKTGVRERIIRGTASQSMFDHFCKGIHKNSITGTILGGTTSASSLHLSAPKDAIISLSNVKPEAGAILSKTVKSHRSMDSFDSNTNQLENTKARKPILMRTPNTCDVDHDLARDISTSQTKSQRASRKKHPVKCSCPFPGIAVLKFDLSSLMFPLSIQNSDKQINVQVSENDITEPGGRHKSSTFNSQGPDSRLIKGSLEGHILRFSLCFLHLWDVDDELDKVLEDEMHICKPEGCRIGAGVIGDRGSLTLMFPGLCSTLKLWKSSHEFSAMRSLTIVSLAQRMITILHTCATASSALAAFYTRNFAEKVPEIKPPLLQLLVSFWQDPSEHVRMAARSLFHCAAPRAAPHPLCCQKTTDPESTSSAFISSVNNEHSSGYLDRSAQIFTSVESEIASIISWLESFEFQEWTLWIRGTNQDAIASNIVVAGALVVWYPIIVKNTLPKLVVNQLLKLVMSANDRYSSTAAELLAEGMENTWQLCLGHEIPHLIGDIFFQIECLSGSPAKNTIQNTAVAVTIREALVEILLPSLAMADVLGYLNVIERQIWATSSDSPVHIVSIKTLIRVVRGSPKLLAPYLDKVVHHILQTMDPGNLVMRKACFSSAMIALREVSRVFPMVSLNETSTRLAVGDAIGDISTSAIRVYDIESVSKIKVLDASGPPGLPSLLEESSNSRITTVITALTFSPDGEGLVAFSSNGLMIRWWSLGTAWWEKLSRSLVPVQCTKLIFVPPEGFSPNSSRSSMISSFLGFPKQNSQDEMQEPDDADLLKPLIHSLDLSYRLQWVNPRKVGLIRHGHELGTFQL
ncbi:uncharacterized protein LOC122042996 isoform X1 [Zingiber officinale]|uniref:uncharacterized protein LOC122042996 isoform X1 n=2 Tax=Zingiber officinale TaxID=94328 RepID=UPI001C4BFBE8|nr:uncharacterized protein LOC122042996 isoform X1 [Zingiber officinale]